MASSTPPTPPISSTSALNAPPYNPTIATGPTSLHTSLTHKLTRDNYSLWKTTVVPILIKGTLSIWL
jgi:hypothetical protein